MFGVIHLDEENGCEMGNALSAIVQMLLCMYELGAHNTFSDL